MTPSQQSHTKEEILQYLLKQGPATAQNLAVAFDLSPQAIRRHLKDLEGEDLIQYQVVHAGVGRPQHVYELSRQGRSHFPASYDEFAVSLLDTLATVAPEQFGRFTPTVGTQSHRLSASDGVRVFAQTLG